MSKISYQALDLAAHRAAGQELAAIFPREGQDRWMVAVGPVGADGPAQWATVSDGPFVQVPVHHYFTRHDAAAAVAYAASLGLAVGAALVRQLTITCNVRQLVVTYADPVEDDKAPDGQPAFGVYLGFAVQVE